MREWQAFPAPIDAIGELVGSIGTQRFAERLLALFNRLMPVDHCRVLVRSDDNQARTWLAAGKLEQRVAARCDLRAQADVDDDVLELVMSHHIDGQYVSTYLSRKFEGRFNSAELATVETYSPVILSAMRQHLNHSQKDEAEPAESLGSLSPERRQKLLAHIRSDLHRFGSISPREAEVCAHIAIGYNINAISMLLGISQNTASTHRKRAYAKLGISSQNELFTRYIEFTPSRETAHSLN